MRLGIFGPRRFRTVARWQAGLCLEYRRCLGRGGGARGAALSDDRTDLGFPAHPRLGRGNLRGDPCEQGQEGKEDTVHRVNHIGTAFQAVQWRRHTDRAVDLCAAMLF